MTFILIVCLGTRNKMSIWSSLDPLSGSLGPQLYLSPGLQPPHSTGRLSWYFPIIITVSSVPMSSSPWKSWVLPSIGPFGYKYCIYLRIGTVKSSSEEAVFPFNQWAEDWALTLVWKMGEGSQFSMMCVLVAQTCPTLCDPMDCSPPGTSVCGILQARIWSGLPFPSPGYLPNPGIEPGSPALQADSLPSEPPWKPPWK